MARRRLTKAQRTEAAQRVGKVYRSKNNGGGVTWVLGQSTTGTYYTAFLSGGAWTERYGTIHPDEWEWYDGPEIAAPQPGETVQINAPFTGAIEDRIVARRGDHVYLDRA